MILIIVLFTHLMNFACQSHNKFVCYFLVSYPSKYVLFLLAQFLTQGQGKTIYKMFRQFIKGFVKQEIQFSNKGALILKGIFTLVPSSKKCAKSLHSTFSLQVTRKVGHSNLAIFLRMIPKMPSEVRPPLSYNTNQILSQVNMRLYGLLFKKIQQYKNLQFFLVNFLIFAIN